MPLLVLCLGVGAGLASALLYREAHHGRRAQTELARLRLDTGTLVQGAFASDRRSGGSSAQALRLIAGSRARIREHVAELSALGPTPRPLDALAPLLRQLDPTVARLYAIGTTVGFNSAPETDGLLRDVAVREARIDDTLDQATDRYDASVSRARLRATVGSAVTLGLLLVAFLVLYRRSGSARARAEALAADNAGLWQVSRQHSVTDELTGLHNRRALNEDLVRLLAQAGHGDGKELLLAMFDLDGFKQYNDTFGHPAGDALLARLGARLAQAVGAGPVAYRMGGDEFCVLALTGTTNGAHVVEVAVAALSDAGEGWSIGCSSGLAWLPTEAGDVAAALHLADQRMYANKASRMSASRQTTSALVQVLAERTGGLGGHAEAVAELSTALAVALGLPAADVQRVGLAAELHDIGKAAIPDAILEKPGPLDEAEWAFIRRHTEIGERIILAAPSMQDVARIVRSSHERVDGGGYPDGLAGDDIPIGARIVATTDAFCAMVSDRSYGRPRPEEEALAELERCAGSQFDRQVVTAFVALRASRTAASVNTV